MNDQTITFYSLQKSIIGYKALHAFKSELTTKQVLPRTKLLQFIIIHMTLFYVHSFQFKVAMFTQSIKNNAPAYFLVLTN